MRAFGLGIRTSGSAYTCFPIAIPLLTASGILTRNENGSQYFAVKVFSIQASVDIGQQELKRHAIMMSNAGSHPGSRHVAINCWSVVLAEPFSRLVCVMDLCGTCLTQLYLTGDQGTKKHWRIHVWRKLFRDMLLALDFLHSECGLVHGDIKGDDILADNVLDDNQLDQLLTRNQSNPVNLLRFVTTCTPAISRTPPVFTTRCSNLSQYLYLPS